MMRSNGIHSDKGQNSLRPHAERTASRTFRMPDSTVRVFAAEARRQGVSVNSLVNRVLSRYVEFDRFCGKFNCNCLNGALLRTLLKSSDKAVLRREGERLGGRFTVDFLKIACQRVDSDSWFFYVTRILGDYSKWFDYEARGDRGANRLVLHHNNGEGWTSFVHGFLLSSLETIGVRGEIKATGNILEVEFQTPHP